jgi:hypothetical protein
MKTLSLFLLAATFAANLSPAFATVIDNGKAICRYWSENSVRPDPTCPSGRRHNESFVRVCTDKATGKEERHDYDTGGMCL